MKNSSKPHVILLYPKTGIDLGSTVAPPHALLSIAAPVVKAGYRVKILDQRTQFITKEILKDLISSDLICFGISTMSGTQILNALNLARAVRELSDGRVPIIWGGTHPSIMPEQTLMNENVDIVSIGESDETFLELVQALQSKKSLRDIKGIIYVDEGEAIRTEDRPLMDVEEILPVPWELIDVEKYIHKDMYLRDKNRVLDIGQTSRGCPFKCGYCSSASIRKRRWRPMSVEKSLAIISESVRRFNLDGIWIRDDEFYINRKRADEIFRGMINQKLDIGFYTSGTRVDVFLKATNEQIDVIKRAGAHHLKFGAESGSQRILDLMNKGITPEMTLEVNRICKKHGIAPVYSLMIGYPTETFEDINKTIDLVYRIKEENPDAEFEAISTYTALPGTPDYELALKYGVSPPDKLEGWCDWLFDEYDFEGRKIPWFDKKQRVHVGNISYMSILANSFHHATMSVRDKKLRLISTAVAKAASRYFNLRLKHKMYKFAPELMVARYLNHLLFQKSNRMSS
jgi:radical SAM superfamily enzyme YgiQ (UPF0313 family)